MIMLVRLRVAYVFRSVLEEVLGSCSVVRCHTVHFMIGWAAESFSGTSRPGAVHGLYFLSQ